MRNIKKILLIFILFIIFLKTPNADCASDYKEVEDQFKVSYKYNAETDDFTITLSTPDYEKYSFYYGEKKDASNAINEVKGKKLISTLNNYKSEEFLYGIIASYEKCFGKMVMYETIKLKKYNQYADDPLCSGNEEFVLCQKEYDKEIDEETFKSRINTYIKSKDKESDTTNKSEEKQKNNDEINDNNLINKGITYVKKNTLVSIIIILFVIALIGCIVKYATNIIKGRRYYE